MRTLYLLSAGALLLAGCDFAGGSDATMAPIARLEASNLPAATGPSADLFFEIQDGTGRAYYRSDVQTGASTESFAAATDGGVEIPSPASMMYVAVYDYETSLQFSRLLARSRGFSAAELTQATLELEDVPFRTTGDSEATFTVTRGTPAE